jgi:hypothetical protein
MLFDILLNHFSLLQYSIIFHCIVLGHFLCYNAQSFIVATVLHHLSLLSHSSVLQHVRQEAAQSRAHGGGGGSAARVAD